MDAQLAIIDAEHKLVKAMKTSSIDELDNCLTMNSFIPAMTDGYTPKRWTYRPTGKATLRFMKLLRVSKLSGL